MQTASRILICGQNDMMEKSLCRHFRAIGFAHVFSAAAEGWDLLEQSSIEALFAEAKPEYVLVASIRSGGIEANQKFPAEFIYTNLVSQTHIIHTAFQQGVKKLIYFSSSCVYPKSCPQPISEDYLLTSSLESTSEAYSVAKIAGIKMCQAYRRQYGFPAYVLIPATLYGPGCHTDLATAHVMGALIAKFSDAVKRGDQSVEIWGSGRPKREFLYIDDFLAAAQFVLEREEAPDILNVGCGYDIAIVDLAQAIAQATGFQGEIRLDPSKPDGALQKLLSSTRLENLGWRAKVSLEEGIQKTCRWYQQEKKVNK
jgi:GDP-L-fucose synthase